MKALDVWESIIYRKRLRERIEYLGIALIILNISDWFFTSRLLIRHGYYEANPIINYVINQYGLEIMLLLKIFFSITFMLVAIYCIDKDKVWEKPVNQFMLKWFPILLTIEYLLVNIYMGIHYFFM